MDFDFTDEQEQIRSAVRNWVTKQYDFSRRRGIISDGGFSRQAYGELAELGLLAIYAPEKYGGLGMGPIEAMIAMEELGRGVALEPLSQAFIACVVLSTYAPESMAASIVPDIASGAQLVVFAHQETDARYGCESRTEAINAPGGGYTISGTKSLVPVGDEADRYIASAMLDGRIALFMVERQANGVETTAYPTQDGARAAEVKFQASPAELLTLNGSSAIDHASSIGLTAACAEAVGVMDKTLEATADYLNTRKQFRVAIGSFQALRHRVADMKMQLELARSMSYYATLKVQSPAAERRHALARAKYQVGQSMRFVGQQAVQLHGGIGMTDEYIVSHYFRKLTQLEFAYGDTLYQLAQVSASMQDDAGVIT
jgi:alkylation response protein AidB-like acyl-CoA dehydrogenase